MEKTLTEYDIRNFAKDILFEYHDIQTINEAMYTPDTLDLFYKQKDRPSVQKQAVPIDAIETVTASMATIVAPNVTKDWYPVNLDEFCVAINSIIKKHIKKKDIQKTWQALHGTLSKLIKDVEDN